jgi:hypothetical protein
MLAIPGLVDPNERGRQWRVIPLTSYPRRIYMSSNERHSEETILEIREPAAEFARKLFD